MPAKPTDVALARLAGLNERTTGEDVAPLRKELQNCMQNYFGVFRTGEYMQKGIAQLVDLRQRIANVKISDKSRRSTPRASKRSSCRTCWRSPRPLQSPPRPAKSRGAHAREDFEERDDGTGCATPCTSGDKRVAKRAVNFAPKTVPAFEPKVPDLLRSPICCK